MVVKVGGMCCTTRTGAWSMTPLTWPSRALSACGPPVEQPTRRTRGGLAGGWRRRHIVGGAERERPQADLGVAAGERRSHVDDEIALLRQEARQRGDAVGVGHVDVEDDDVGAGALDLLDGLAAAAQRGDDLEARLGLDPAHEEAADDDGVV